jgi:hypothetical protein
MEIKPAYPLAPSERTPVVIVKKGRGRYGDFDVEKEARDFIPPGNSIEDIVDLTTEDIIHIDLTNTKTARPLRDSAALLYPAAPIHKEKGTIIDIWA